jgi:hypothetical protein
VALLDMNLGGHSNLVIMTLYINMATIATLLVHRALASTHLLTKYVKMSMYQFCAYLVATLMGPTKFIPHCKKGAMGWTRCVGVFARPSKVCIEMACLATMITRDNKSGM